jgi:predicted transcriptional regulator
MTRQLTRAEEQVMLVLWKLGESFLKDIVENSPEPVPHSNTVATILKILVEKGFVEYEIKGRNNLYRASITKEEYGKKTINQVVKGYFEGSPAKLVSHFVSDNKISLQELETLLLQIKSSKKRGK